MTTIRDGEILLPDIPFDPGAAFDRELAPPQQAPGA